MALLTLARQEWAAILDQLNASYGDSAPPGLCQRIAALLAITPSAWSEQACQLEVADLAAVTLVNSMVRQRQEQSGDSTFLWQEQASVAEAEQIIRDCQHWSGEE
jgi:hypothetical protein